MVDGKPTMVLTRDIQFHPVSDAPLHMDMLRVAASSKVAVGIPVEFINHEKSPGLKIGGVLNIVRHEVELNCLQPAFLKKLPLISMALKLVRPSIFLLSPFQKGLSQPSQTEISL